MIRGDSVHMVPGYCALRGFLMQTEHLVRGSASARVCVITLRVIIVVQMTSGQSHQWLFHPSRLEGHATEEAAH